MYRLYQGKTEQKPAWHFHRGVTWNGVPYLGNAELFESRQRVEHEGLSLEVPSPEHAVMIYAGHALFENYVIPLGELYDVSVFSQEVQNWEAIYALARQNGWEGALKGYICLARGLSKRFGIENALPDLGVSRLRSGSLPYRVPWGLETKAFHGRISHNLRARQFRRAFRELYAYPAFFALEQVKLLLGYA
jgi:hypothetical protein